MEIDSDHALHVEMKISVFNNKWGNIIFGFQKV